MSKSIWDKTLSECTLRDIVLWFDHIYPKDLFVKHPVAFIRKMLKWLAGDDCKVLLDEGKYEFGSDEK